MSERLIRENERKELTGIPISSWHEMRKSGLAPPPVRLGAYAIAYPKSELDALIAARIAGKGDDEIRELVTKLVAARSHAFDRFEAA